MGYTGVCLQERIRIEELFTIHYFEYATNFSFPGERHDFWEFVCVDKGNVNITTDQGEYVLRKGEIAFHKPNEFHTVSTSADSAPNLVVIAFRCDSPDMDFFREKILKIDQKERTLLADILLEARKLFFTPLNDPYVLHMEKHAHAPFGSEQLILLYLEQFLISLYRRHTESVARFDLPVTSEDANIFQRVCNYMENNLSSRLTVDKICRDNMIGRTPLHKIFHQKTGVGIIEYFSRLKIDEAKHLIRTGRLNFTQISEQLGYNSIHYFSRQFKKITGMTPSEYASSIKAISERNL